MLYARNISTVVCSFLCFHLISGEFSLKMSVQWYLECTFASKSKKKTVFVWLFAHLSVPLSRKQRLSMYKRLFLALVACFLFVPLAQTKKKEKRSLVLLETSAGPIRVALFDDTPLHRDNFIRLASSGFYEGTLFHRVIRDFMVQGGDPDSRKALPGQQFGDGGPGYTIPAEISLPYLYHWRGALAAAREPDDVNPERRSSGSQFYFVWGKKQTPAGIKKARELLRENDVELTSHMVDDYIMRGGTPHLDGAYTVFGEVVDGLQTVERILDEPTDENDRPLLDVVVQKVTVLQKSKDAIQRPTKLSQL